MKKATTLFTLLLLLAGVGMSANAQIRDVTVREINAINADSVAALLADGAAVDLATIGADPLSRIFGDQVAINAGGGVGDSVRFVAVVMSNPKTSGLGNLTAGVPSRIHVFLRDTSAATTGPEGQGIQLTDSSFPTTGVGDLLVGDVVEVIGTVEPFNQTMQIDPDFARVLGDVSSFGLPASIMDPITVTTADINNSVGAAGEIQPNWSNLADLRGAYVRIEGAQVQQRTIAPGGRPDWMISTDGGATSVIFYDTSLRFRNDRSDYPSDFNPRDGDFTPPPPGSVINLQGYLVVNNDNPFNVTTPVSMVINPFEDSDLEITISPPIISSIELSDIVPGADPIGVTTTIVPDPSRTVASAQLHYYSSTSADTTSADPDLVAGDNYSFTIPAAADGDFVTFWIASTDNVGSESRSDDASYRVLVDGIDSISDVQETASGGPGDSPFAFNKVPMNVTGIVQNDGSVSGFYVLQSDAGMAPWTGVLLDSSDPGVATLTMGDQITITEAYVDESFGVTQLDSLTFTVDLNTSPHGYKVVPTDVLQDPAIAEAHEGMLLRFDNVTITSADAGFGEWSFSSDGTTDNEVNADDASNDIAGSFNTDTFADDDAVEFIQGIWWFSFGTYKLVPETASDVGGINVGLEDEILPGEFALAQNYPNPFSGSTTVEFALGNASHATIEVFDLLGRQVATLVDRELPAGVHEATFDTDGFGSGMYLYRLTAGENVITKTMLLVK